jgi:hypothetical protein
MEPGHTALAAPRVVPGGHIFGLLNAPSPGHHQAGNAGAAHMALERVNQVATPLINKREPVKYCGASREGFGPTNQP